MHTPRPHDGPISITMEYQVDRARGRELMNIVRQVRLIHLRNGAYSWQLHEDLGRPNIFRVELAVPSWNEYLLVQERLTKNEQEIIRMAENLHVRSVPPETRFFLGVNRQLHTHRHSRETKTAKSIGADVRAFGSREVAHYPASLSCRSLEGSPAERASSVRLYENLDRR